MFNITIKTLRDKRFLLLGWSLGLIFLSYLMTVFYPSFNGGQIDELMSSMPPAMQGLVGEMQDWRELPGYIGSQIFDIRLPIFVSILSIMLAIGVTVGEEDRGRLRTLLALPISRRGVVLGKWLGVVAICFIASAATVAGVVIGALQIQESVEALMLVRLGLFTWLQITALATIIFAVGLSTGKRGVTTAIAVIIAIGGFLLSTFAPAVDWLQAYEWTSFFYYFPAVDIAKGVVEWQNAAVYIASTILALALALMVFARRDVHSS